MADSYPIHRRQVVAAGVAAATITIVPRHVLGGPVFKCPARS